MYEMIRDTKKIGVISDLHLDTKRDSAVKEQIAKIKNDYSEADLLVVAGDMCEVAGMMHYAKMLADCAEQIAFVPGNHERWGSSLELCDEELRNVEAKIPNFHYLNNERGIVGGVPIFGGTMWTDLKQDAINSQNQSSTWPDFSRIIDFTPAHWNDMYKEFRQRALEDFQEGDLMVTHHMPLMSLVNERYAQNPYNIFYASDSDLLNILKPKLWIYGHTHVHTDVEKGNTRFLCNPLGYQHETTMCKPTIVDF